MTTCRRYIITGMNRRWKIFNFIWILAAVSSRTVYYFLSRSSGALAGFLGLSPREVLDTYGYFEYAMVRAGDNERVLAEGLSYGYGESLSRLLRFVGNRTEAVCVYQMVLQILWLLLFFAGMSLLFGRLAGITAGTILVVSPFIMNTVFVICPENYYMFQWTVVLTVLGCLQIPVQNRGLSNWSRLSLIVMGFYLGVICIRNSLGFYLPLWLLSAVTAGIACQWLFGFMQRKKKPEASKEGEEAAVLKNTRARRKEDKKMPVEEKQDEYFIAEDGRRIKYIENPLPGPKKHVKREMDFDLQEYDDLLEFPDENEFDYKISENDDFDF